MTVSKKLVLGCMIAWFGMWAGMYPAYCGTPLSDEQKKAEVYQLYDGFHKEFAGVTDIGVTEAKNLYDAGSAVFVDTRKTAEIKVSHLPGAISEKAFRDHPERYTHLTVIAYCTISYRSGYFARRMAKEGRTVLNLRGGILAWTLEGEPVYSDGRPTKRLHVYDASWNFAPAGYETVVFNAWEKLLN